MNILIIGNGFDLEHGLPTTYNDFLLSVKGYRENYSEEFFGNKETVFLKKYKENLLNAYRDYETSYNGELSDKQNNLNMIWIDYFKQLKEKEKDKDI